MARAESAEARDLDVLSDLQSFPQRHAATVLRKCVGCGVVYGVARAVEVASGAGKKKDSYAAGPCTLRQRASDMRNFGVMSPEVKVENDATRGSRRRNLRVRLGQRIFTPISPRIQHYHQSLYGCMSGTGLFSFSHPSASAARAKVGFLPYPSPPRVMTQLPWARAAQLPRDLLPSAQSEQVRATASEIERNHFHQIFAFAGIRRLEESCSVTTPRSPDRGAVPRRRAKPCCVRHLPGCGFDLILLHRVLSTQLDRLCIGRVAPQCALCNS